MPPPSRGCPHADTVPQIAARAWRSRIRAAQGRESMNRRLGPQSRCHGVSGRHRPTEIAAPDSLRQPAHQIAVLAEDFLDMSVQSGGVAGGGKAGVKIENVRRKREI